MGRVIGYQEPIINQDGIQMGGKVILETNSDYQVLLPYLYLSDEKTQVDKAPLPAIGSEIQTIVKNHVNDVLYVSSRPSDLDEKEIYNYKHFYKFVEKNAEGTIVHGVVKKVMPFGLFVDLQSNHLGIVDIGFQSLNQSKKLPVDRSDWPKEGDKIRCIIEYYTFINRQVGLSWVR